MQSYLEFIQENISKKLVGEWKLEYSENNLSLTFVNESFFKKVKKGEDVSSAFIEVGSIIAQTNNSFILNYGGYSFNVKKQINDVWIGNLNNIIYTLTKI
jgi:hypothetical protein